MTQTAWAHLPNAKHIDWVLASVKEHPEKWDAAWGAAYYSAYSAAQSRAKAAARTAVWYAARSVTWTITFYTAAPFTARSAARGVLVALITYDDCAYMIESEIDEIKILAKLGDQRALLLLPACIVYNETKVLV